MGPCIHFPLKEQSRLAFQREEGNTGKRPVRDLFGVSSLLKQACF